MEIVSESVPDRATARRVVREAFGGEGARVAALVDALGAAGHLRASIVAKEGGEVVGYVGLSRSWVDARERLVEVLVLSPRAAAPGHQRRGIGGALVAAARERAGELGAPALFLEGDPAYYGRHGYVGGAAAGFVRPSERIPQPGFQVLLLPAHEPWMRGALVYCDPFWAHDCVGLRDPLLARQEQS